MGGRIERAAVRSSHQGRVTSPRILTTSPRSGQKRSLKRVDVKRVTARYSAEETGREKEVEGGRRDEKDLAGWNGKPAGEGPALITWGARAVSGPL